MSDRLYVMTFENGVQATSPTALIPVDIVETRVRPFIQDRRATDGREIEFDLLFWDRSGFGRSAQQDSVQLTITLNDDDDAYATSVCIAGWSDNDELAAIVLALLQSANAVSVLDGATPPVVGRLETIAHLPANLVATLGPVYLAQTPDKIFGDGAAATEERARPTATTQHHRDEIAYWRQLQVVKMYRERVHLFARQAEVVIRSIIERAQAESESPDSIMQIRDYLALVEHEGDMTRDLARSDWQQRADEAHGAVVAFNLPGRVDRYRIKTRFSERLLEVDRARDNRSSCLEVAGDADTQARVLEEVVAEQGLSTTPPLPADSLPPAAFDDAALMAAHLRASDNLNHARREVWSHLKSLTDMFPRNPQWMVAFDNNTKGWPIVASVQRQLVILRKDARADQSPEWDQRVAAALGALDSPAIVQAVLAQPFMHGPDHALMAIARALELTIPRFLSKATEAKARLAALSAEIGSRMPVAAGGATDQ